MEKPKLDWKTFTSRRHLDVGAWIKSKAFKSYLEMKAWLTARDMIPPSKEEVENFFKKEKAIIEKPLQKEEIKIEEPSPLKMAVPEIVEMEATEEDIPKKSLRKKKLDLLEDK
jgi:hypothetical protein